MKHRDRQSAFGLLPRMEARPRKDGRVTYRYHPVGGKPIALGTDKGEALRRVLDLLGRASDDGTVEHVWRMYRESTAWSELSEKTREDYAECSKSLLRVFATCHVSYMQPKDIARYLRVERADAPVRANREVALLSNLMNLAIERGDIVANPCKQVRRNRERARKVIPLAGELDALLAWLRSRGKQWGVIAAMAEFASKSGARRIELLRATVFQVRDSEARLIRGKQRAGEITDVIELSPEALAILYAIRRDDTTYLFPTRSGQPYTDSGFKAMWSKAMTEAIRRGIVTQRFTFHDLRAHYATQHKQILGALPDLHKDPGTTARVYDRSTEVRRRTV